MATPKAQRIGIWIIAIVMTVGTIGSFIVMVLANDNAAKDQQQQQAAAQKAQGDYEKTLKPLDGYKAEAFDASSVTKLDAQVLKAGTGATVKDDATLTVSYFGWTADGKIFDSTNKSGTNTPADGLSLSQVIEGWKQGLAGQKVGSTVELTIPTDLAYGTSAASNGQPAGPLKFIVEIIAAK